MNSVTLHGRLSRDPEMRTTQTGKAFARFYVAVDRMTKEKAADFIPCTAWGQTAELIAKYFNKGKEILLEGRIQTGSYTDKEGNKRYTTDVVANRIEFCGSKGGNSNNADGFENAGPISDTEIPF